MEEPFKAAARGLQGALDQSGRLITKAEARCVSLWTLTVQAIKDLEDRYDLSAREVDRLV
jgi:hypothetical protein